MGLIGRDANTGHALFIPLPLQSHMIPLLGLAKQLARKGIAITFVSFEDEISRLTSADSFSELQSLGIQFIGLDNSGREKTGYAVVISPTLREAFKPLMEKLVQDKRSGVAGPTCIISDMFLPWTEDVADTLQIPRYMFVIAGVITVRYMQNYPDLFEHRLVLSETDGTLVKFDGTLDIPGIFPLRYHELPDSTIRWPRKSLVRSKTLWTARGVLANSFYELEEQMIERWSTPKASESKHTQVPKIYPVAPLFSTSVIVPEITIAHGLEDAAEKSLVWLGSQPSCSVLYVAFGTLAHLSSGHINELALGLEESNQRFLWVLPQSKVSSEEEAPLIINALPPGFEARVGDRGCIVSGWVPQLQILAHSSTAAFLTHSGWNSCLESIMMGVPMISWPQMAEQHLNCRYLTDTMKISIQLQTGAENILDRKEVVRVVRLLMEESEGKEIRRRIEDLQRKGAAAVAEGGSQSKILQDLVDDINLTAKTGDTQHVLQD